MPCRYLYGTATVASYMYTLWLVMDITTSCKTIHCNRHTKSISTAVSTEVMAKNYSVLLNIYSDCSIRVY